MIKYNCWKSLY